MLSIVILLGVIVIGMSVGPRSMLAWQLIMVGLPVVILLVGFLFIIRGYEIRPDSLLVYRLGWQSRIPLSGLRSVDYDPKAMSHSIRTFGNGGMFCFAGWFRNKKLGSYRAYATDLKRCVILKFADGRVIVVTPGEPKVFVEQTHILTGV